MSNKEEAISAIAYRIGREIETFIHTTTNNIEYRNKLLEAKILEFRKKLEFIDCTAGGSICICLPEKGYCDDITKIYDEHFGIEISNKGKI